VDEEKKQNDKYEAKEDKSTAEASRTLDKDGGGTAIEPHVEYGKVEVLV